MSIECYGLSLGQKCEGNFSCPCIALTQNNSLPYRYVREMFQHEESGKCPGSCVRDSQVWQLQHRRHQDRPDPVFRFLIVSLTRSIQSFNNHSHFMFFPAKGFQHVFYWLRDPGAGFIYNPYDSRLRAILSLFFAPLYSRPNL